ncbi:hypothetical protein AAZV13_04G101850 [Glycine max]
MKTCGTREYRCDCGTLFSRRDSFITHRAFCDVLAQESARAQSFISRFSMKEEERTVGMGGSPEGNKPKMGARTRMQRGSRGHV